MNLNIYTDKIITTMSTTTTATEETSSVSFELQEVNYLANLTNETFTPNYSNISQSGDPDRGDNITQISVLCIKSFIFGSIIIGAVLGNALVILAVRRNRKLR